MENVDYLAEQAVHLKPIDRIKLVETILMSLDKADPEIEARWIEEADARFEAYKRGELKTTDWNEIKKRYE